MHDSYGDGWNGNIFTLTDADGNVVSTGGLDAGADGSVVFNYGAVVVPGCTDATAFNYNDIATEDDGSCVAVVEGCKDDTATNYNADANVDDASCTYPYACATGELLLSMVDSYGDSWNGSELIINGSSYTVAVGSNAEACITDGCLIFSTVEGSYMGEASWSLSNEAGDVVAADGLPYSGSLGECGVLGCMDATACDYDSLATMDNGCTYATEGFDCDGNCLSGDAVVYTAGLYANEHSFTITDCDGAVLAEMTSGVDGFASCVTLPAIYSVNMFDTYNDGWDGATLTVGGLTYDAEAVYNVGSCPVYGCTDSLAANFDAAADTDDASCTYGVAGCTDASACNFDALATADDNSCTYALAGFDCEGSCLSGSAVEVYMSDSYGDGWNGNVLAIGTDSLTIESGDTGSATLCLADGIYTVTNGGGLYGAEVSWSIDSVLFGGSPFEGSINIGDVAVPGCTDSTAFNFDSEAGVDDGSCVAVSYGCIDVTAENFNADANTSDESCTYIPGCMDPTAINFTPSATEDDGSCNYVSCLDTDALLTFTMPSSWGSETSLSIVDVNGQELAFIQGGSEVAYTNDLCLSAANSYTAILMDAYGDGWGTGASFSVSTCDGSLVAVEGTLLAGSIDSMAFAVQSCDSYSFGCMDSIASNFDASATEDDGTCTYPGCTDAMYLEFDETANLDDESCLTLVVEGCMDASASNHVVDANVEDGSCILPIACDSGLVGMVIYMEDSYGDSWNGNEYSLLNSAGDLVAMGTVAEGFSAQDTLCVAADCYAISVGGGSYVGETSWSISTEYNGASIANAGGEDVAAFGIGSDGDCSSLLGCSDSYASNYNEAAIANDGSCEYITSVTCEEAIAIDANSTVPGAFNEQVWFSITLESAQFVSAEALPAAGFWYVGDIAIMTACDSTGVSVEQGVLEAGTYYISVNNSSTWANGDGYELTVNAADVLEGCTDPYADNYNELSNIDDASCLYPCEGIPATLTINTASYGSELYWELLDAEGMVAAYGGPYADDSANEVPVCLAAGMDYTMNAYDSYGDGWNGGTYDVIATCGEDSLTSFTYIVANNGGATPSDGEFGTGGEDFALESAEVFTVVACSDVIAGCMDETMFNYDSLANVSSGACEEIVYGCMDSEALNFNADVNTDDVSCIYGCDGEFVTVNVTEGSYASEVSWELLNATGDTLMSGGGLDFTEQICLPIGDAFIFAAHDSYGDGWNGGSFSVVSCEAIMEGGVEQVGDTPTDIGADYQFTVVSCADIVPGCTNVQAENFNADATHSDGSCVFTMPNILNPTCGSTIDLATADSIVFNWEALIGEGSTPAYYYIMWSTDSADLEGSTSIYANTYGAADSLSYVDYEGLYNLFVDNGYGAGSEFSLYMWISTDGYWVEGASTQFANNGCEITLTLSALNGCDDAAALNYNADATVNDGTCIYPCDSTQATLMMYNTYGSGWGDAALLINYEEYSFEDGEAAMACVDIDTAGCITFGFNGWASSATSWVLYNQSAEELASGGAGSFPENMGECTEGCMDASYLEFNQDADIHNQEMCENFLCDGDVVSLDLVDSYGDGWNGGTITVNGADYTMGSGSAISHGLCVDLSTCIEVIYTAGSYSYENSWSISDEAGNVLVEAADASGNIGAGCAVLGCMEWML